MNRRRFYQAALLSALLALPACDSVKETVGLTRSAPDEFKVVKRAPLEMPPDFSLRPPRPGAARPQEEAMDSLAREAAFGSAAAGSSAPTNAEAVLLQQTGGAAADPAIRAVVDRETATMEPREKPVAERLLGWSTGGSEEPATSVVDAPAEAERLKQNEAEGRPVTEGETPSKEE